MYSTVCSVLSECLWKNFTGDSGGIRTHNLLLTSADVLTSRPPSLPDDNLLARIPYSSGFRDYRFPPESPVKFFTDTRKALNMCYTHVGVQDKIKSPIIAEPAAIWDSSRPIVIGQLGGREVKTSALVSRRSWVRITYRVYNLWCISLT